MAASDPATFEVTAHDGIVLRGERFGGAQGPAAVLLHGGGQSQSAWRCAARLLADNPALANLRLLQAIEQGKGATTVVLGDAATAAMIGATLASA